MINFTQVSGKVSLDVGGLVVGQNNALPVQGVDGDYDAFSRYRVSNPFTLFEVQHQYGIQPLLWKDTTANSGTITHLPNESSVLLTVGTASGSKVIRQMKEYFRYQPGKSQLIVLTAVLGTAATGVIRRLGYFDDNNGFFFQQTSTGLSVGLRSNVTGSPVDTTIAQASWNLDPLDGTGPSGVTVDPTKAQIFVIDFQWLGAGRVRYGVNIAGETIYVHEILNSNTQSTVYCTTANLPVRYEIQTTTVIGGTVTMRQICSTVISEGGFSRYGFPFSANNGSTGISVSTRRPILSIQPATTFNSISNSVTVLPLEASLLCLTQNVFFEIVLNGTLTSPSFSSVNANSSVNYDVSATAISGGMVISSGYVAPATSGNKSASVGVEGLLSKLALTSSDMLSIVCTSLTSTATCYGTFDWHEVY